MFKRILVAVDGSPTANRGFKVALELAKEHDATLYVLHVVEDVLAMLGFDGATYTPAEYVDSMQEGLRNAGRKVLAQAEKTAQQHGQRVQPLLVETLGHRVAHAVITQARKLRCELIVLGTHGRRGLARLMMGSDAEAIVREARVPVLLVRSPLAPRASRSAKKPAATRRPGTRAPGTSSAQGAASPKQPATRRRAT